MIPTADLTRRYGAPAPWRRRALVVGSVVVAVVAGVWLAWTAWFHATPEVESELVGYRIVDEHTATAVLALRFKDADVEATCLLRAYAADHSVVGELSFRPSGAVDGSVSQTVRTVRRATSVEKVGCTAPDQVRPR